MILFAGCSALYETAMPFNNLGYTTRLFPVQSNNFEKTFRVWFNNGTSIDRIITVSMDSVLPPYGMGYESNFVDIGSVYKRRLFSDKLRNKSVKIFKTRDIQPRSGYDRFFEKLDSLNLFEYQKQTDFIWRFGHRPISFYVVEGEGSIHAILFPDKLPL